MTIRNTDVISYDAFATVQNNNNVVIWWLTSATA